MATLTVGTGPGYDYSTLSSAVAAAQDGDVVAVEAGTYQNDFATVNADITIIGVGGMVVLQATVPPPDQKSILTINTSATIENVEFTGAAIPADAGGNAAGIRFEPGVPPGGNLAINNCYFYQNQEGILADDQLEPDGTTTGSITINNSEFYDNGSGTGYTHNLYVNHINLLKITNSYFHGAVVGHEIKSRAANTIIENSRIENGPTGSGSIGIDLPNGGNATIENNVIEKGPHAQNPNMIAFGEEGGVYPSSSLTVSGNTMINDQGASTTMVWNDTGVTANITDNTTYGLTDGLTGGLPNQLVSGQANLSGNTVAPQSAEPALNTSDPFLSVPVTSACFASGTRILTRDGEVPVEALRAGQQAIVVQSGELVSRPIQWIGWSTVDLAAHPTPELACPVRIRGGAFADGVPRHDLYLSPDHAVFVDGMLVPVRLLVNGGTIAQDMSRQRIRYHHVELDSHSVILAEGLPCESYLDTGNRSAFANGGVQAALHPTFAVNASLPCWQTDACAPLVTSPAPVEPVWRRLADRSARLGLPKPTVATTSEPDLRLVVYHCDQAGMPEGAAEGAAGTTIHPIRTGQGRHRFVLPHGVMAVRIVSRWAVPAALTPATDDRRRLGVSVQRIILRRGTDRHEMAVDDPILREGWWEVEREGATQWRWTNGNAVLTLPEGTREVVLQIAGGLRYPAEASGAQTQSAAA